MMGHHSSCPGPVCPNSPYPAQQEQWAGKHEEADKPNADVGILRHDRTKDEDCRDGCPKGDSRKAVFGSHGLFCVGLAGGMHVPGKKLVWSPASPVAINEALDPIQSESSGLADGDISTVYQCFGAVLRDLEDHYVAARRVALSVHVVEHHLKRWGEFKDFCHSVALSILSLRMGIILACGHLWCSVMWPRLAGVAGSVATLARMKPAGHAGIPYPIPRGLPLSCSASANVTGARRAELPRTSLLNLGRGRGPAPLFSGMHHE